VGAVVLLALIPAAVAIPALAALALVSAVCALVVAYEAIRYRGPRRFGTPSLRHDARLRRPLQRSLPCGTQGSVNCSKLLPASRFPADAADSKCLIARSTTNSGASSGVKCPTPGINSRRMSSVWRS
jgi:hypothetical protein